MGDTRQRNTPEPIEKVQESIERIQREKADNENNQGEKNNG